MKSELGKQAAASAVNKRQRTISFPATPAIHEPPIDTYSNTNPRQKAITEALITMVADSMLPFQFVESKGLKKFMAIVEPKYNIPSRRTVTRRTTDKLQTLKDSIKNDIDKLYTQNLHCSCDD